MFESEATLLKSYTATAQLQVNFYAEGGECPVIDEIDGGDTTGDGQFVPINGLLEGGNP